MKLQLITTEGTYLQIDTWIPPSKNNKTNVFGSRSTEVKRFYHDCKTATVEYMHLLQDFLKDYDPKKELLNIDVYSFQEYDRGDLHNTNEILADGLQELLGINDLYYVIVNHPRMYDPREHLIVNISKRKNLFAESRKGAQKQKKMIENFEKFMTKTKKARKK